MAHLICGWPKRHWPGERSVCPCGFLFPDRVLRPEWHDKNYQPKELSVAKEPKSRAAPSSDKKPRAVVEHETSASEHKIKLADVDPKAAVAVRVSRKKVEPQANASAFTWIETIPGEQWVTDRIPDGETSTPRIRQSGSDGEGKRVFFCYRSGQYLDCTDTLEGAKIVCEEGMKNINRIARADRIKEYVDQHPGEVPPFLLLTKEERAGVAATYPYAMPSKSKLAASVRERTDVDPELLKEIQDQVSAEKRMRTGKAPKEPRASRAAKGAGLSMTATMARGKDGNPKKPGSSAHARWEAMFAACAAGSTVQAYADAGGNLETLENAVKQGYARLEGG